MQTCYLCRCGDDIIDAEEIPSGFLENVYGKEITNLKKQLW